MNHLVTLLLALFVSVSSFASMDPSLISAAHQLWEKRAYNTEGAERALSAGQLFEQQAQLASNNYEKAQMLIGAARAYYFYAQICNSAETKLKFYDLAVHTAEEGLALFGVVRAQDLDESFYQQLHLSPEQADQVAHLLYEKAAAFGQWLKARADEGVLGKLEAMNRFSELEAICHGLYWLRKTAVNYHGYERVLGYALYNKGLRVGGSAKEQGYQMLENGFKATFDSGLNTSVYGANAVFFAEALKGKGQTARAKQILRDLLKAKVENMAHGFEVENQKAQSDAQALLKAWD